MSESRPPQHQEHQPGREAEMSPRPRSDRPEHRGTGRLDGKTVVITGGDSGIGRAVALSVAKEGANAAIVYLNEHEDAQETQRLVAERGRDSVTIAGDAGDDGFCRDAIRQTLERFGSVDYLVNNAGEQHPQTDFTKISREQLERTFRTNIFSFFYMTQAALPRLHEGSAIVNMASVNAYSTGADLDAAHSCIVSTRRSREVWSRRADETPRRTGRSSCCGFVFIVRCCLVYYRPDASSQRWHDR